MIDTTNYFDSYLIENKQRNKSIDNYRLDKISKLGVDFDPLTSEEIDAEEFNIDSILAGKSDNALVKSDTDLVLYVGFRCPNCGECTYQRGPKNSREDATVIGKSCPLWFDYNTNLLHCCDMIIETETEIEIEIETETE